MALSLIFAPLIGAALMPILRKIWSRATSIVAVLVALYLVAVTFGSACLELLGANGLLYQKVVMGGIIVLRIDGLALLALVTISLVTLITLYHQHSRPIKGEDIAEVIQRNPGTIRNQMQALKAIGYDGPVTPEPFCARLAQMTPEDNIKYVGEMLKQVWDQAGV